MGGHQIDRNFPRHAVQGGGREGCVAYDGISRTASLVQHSGLLRHTKGRATRNHAAVSCQGYQEGLGGPWYHDPDAALRHHCGTHQYPQHRRWIVDPRHPAPAGMGAGSAGLWPPGRPRPGSTPRNSCSADQNRPRLAPGSPGRRSGPVQKTSGRCPSRPWNLGRPANSPDVVEPLASVLRDR